MEHFLIDCQIISERITKWVCPRRRVWTDWIVKIAKEIHPQDIRSRGSSQKDGKMLLIYSLNEKKIIIFFFGKTGKVEKLFLQRKKKVK